MGRFLRDYGLSLALAALFLGSWIAHALTGWVAFAADQQSHNQTAQLFGPSGYIWDWLEGTFENWQSEFLQLIWQVVGLAFFLYVGSPTSKENDDRLETKIDALLRINAGSEADPLIEKIDKYYFREEGHAKPHGHEEEFHKEVGHGVRHVAARG